MPTASWGSLVSVTKDLLMNGAKSVFMLGLHYVPGGHGNHVSGHRGQNGMDVRQRGGTGWAT